MAGSGGGNDVWRVGAEEMGDSGVIAMPEELVAYLASILVVGVARRAGIWQIGKAAECD